MTTEVVTVDPEIITQKTKPIVDLQSAPPPIHDADKGKLIDVSAIPADVSAIPADFIRMVNRFTSDPAEQDRIFANAAEFFSLLPVASREAFVSFGDNSALLVDGEGMMNDLRKANEILAADPFVRLPQGARLACQFHLINHDSNSEAIAKIHSLPKIFTDEYATLEKIDDIVPAVVITMGYLNDAMTPEKIHDILDTIPPVFTEDTFKKYELNVRMSLFGRYTEHNDIAEVDQLMQNIPADLHFQDIDFLHALFEKVLDEESPSDLYEIVAVFNSEEYLSVGSWGKERLLEAFKSNTPLQKLKGMCHILSDPRYDFLGYQVMKQIIQSYQDGTSSVEDAKLYIDFFSSTSYTQLDHNSIDRVNDLLDKGKPIKMMVEAARLIDQAPNGREKDYICQLFEDDVPLEKIEEIVSMITGTNYYKLNPEVKEKILQMMQKRKSIEFIMNLCIVMTADECRSLQYAEETFILQYYATDPNVERTLEVARYLGNGQGFQFSRFIPTLLKRMNEHKTASAQEPLDIIRVLGRHADIEWGSFERLILLQLIEGASSAEKIDTFLIAIESAKYKGLDDKSKYTIITRSESELSLNILIASIDFFGSDSYRKLDEGVQSYLRQQYENREMGVEELNAAVTTFNGADIKDLPSRLKIIALGLVNKKRADKIGDLRTLYEEFARIEQYEVNKIQDELIELLIELPIEQSLEALRRIIQIFKKNNLPLIGKQFLIFDVLYFSSPDIQKCQFAKEFNIARNSGVNLSPALGRFYDHLIENHGEQQPTDEDVKKKQNLLIGLKRRFWSDLLKLSIESADPDLMTYLEHLRDGETILQRIAGNNLTDLSEADAEQLKKFFDRIDSMTHAVSTSSTNLAHDRNDLQARYDAFRVDLGVQENQSLMEKITEMFLAPARFHSLEDAIHRMKEVKGQAHDRNLLNEDVRGGSFRFQAGDLLKGVSTSALPLVLRYGSRSREHIGVAGSGAYSDRTPFDVDTSRILHKDIAEQQTNPTAVIDSSLSKNYGEYILVIRNRGQFYRNKRSEKYKDTTADDFDNEKSADNSTPLETSSKPRYELFFSNVFRERHFGVRTGLPSTEIDAIVVQKISKDPIILDELYFQIANNGFYIPVCDRAGKVLFSEADYERHKINADALKEKLDKDDADSAKLIDTFKTSPYLKTLFEMDSGVHEILTLEEHTRMVLKQFDTYFNNDFSSALISKQEMKLLLTLHDAGKSLAVSQGKKHNQHVYTKSIMEFIFPSIGMPAKRADTLISIMDQDIIGQFFMRYLSPKDAADQIHELADTIGCTVSELMPILKAFYICDAGAYTEDATGDPEKNTLGRIFQFTHGANASTADFSPEYAARYADLLARVS